MVKNARILRRITIILLLVCLMLNLTGCAYEVRDAAYVERICGLDLQYCILVRSEDSHGGFLGDGALIVEFDCRNCVNAIDLQVKKWNALPLSENLQLIMYGGERDGMCYGYHLAEECGIPEIQNGHYFFLDRHSESDDPANDEELFDRHSYNFTLILYDADSMRLYLFEFDT